MNFKHQAIKTICKRMLLDHRAQPCRIELDDGVYDVHEGYIDVIRLTNNCHRFAIVFSIDDIQVRLTCIFGVKSRNQHFSGFVKGDFEQSVSIAYSNDYNGIDKIWVEEVIEEILSIAEDTSAP